MAKNKSSPKTAANLMAAHAAIFRCPLCGEAMQLSELKSLVCGQKHCFDVARTGYVNFLHRPHHTKYTREMFAYRRIISDSGFFTPLVEAIAEIVINAHSSPKSLHLLDAGCGAGDFLAGLIDRIKNKYNGAVLGVGMDIAKAGVDMAARGYRNQLWCVADIANCPWADNSFQVITNVLSPANYAEFNRMLSTDGILIKVIPGLGYLQELRAVLYDRAREQQYSDADVKALFSHHFNLTLSRQITYQFSVTDDLIAPLVHMTPLSWGATPMQLQKISPRILPHITVDYTILAGRK